MGMYWQTYFYSDPNVPSDGVLLANMDPIIDEHDVSRGYRKA
jgi:hypothetical protein